MSKVVLITGGSSGIGKSVGEYLSKKGYIVYGTSRNPQKIKTHPFKLIALDVNDTTTISKAIETVISNEGKIDVLINNAGMGITGSIEDTPTDEMRNVFNTNFFGAIDVMKAVLPQMRKQRSGLIVNTSIFPSDKITVSIAFEIVVISFTSRAINLKGCAFIFCGFLLVP